MFKAVFGWQRLSYLTKMVFPGSLEPIQSPLGNLCNLDTKESKSSQVLSNLGGIQLSCSDDALQHVLNIKFLVPGIVLRHVLNLPSFSTEISWTWFSPRKIISYCSNLYYHGREWATFLHTFLHMGLWKICSKWLHINLNFRNYFQQSRIFFMFLIFLFWYRCRETHSKGNLQ